MKTSKRWFPKIGDLVAIPYDGVDTVIKHGVRPRASYGVVIGEDKDSDFGGVWWKIYAEGKLTIQHLHDVQPLLDIQGKWLKVK